MEIHYTIFPPQYNNRMVHPRTKNNIYKWVELNNNLSLNPKIWDINQAKNFLIDFSKEFGYDILKWFDYENDGRYKSDIFRLCILYEFGGIYVDIDQEPLISMSEYIDFNLLDFVGCSNMGLHNLSNGFIFSKKKSNIIKKNIEEIISRYQSNGTKGGCHVMGSVITNLINGEPLKMPLGFHRIGGENCLFLHEIGDESLPNTSQEHFNSFGVYAKNDTLKVMNSRYHTYHIDKYDINNFILI